MFIKGSVALASGNAEQALYRCSAADDGDSVNH
jgi:hypothetical protein